MGSRSEVQGLIAFKTASELTTFIAKHRVSSNALVREALQSMRPVRAGEQGMYGLHFIEHDVYWNDSYPDVEAFFTILNDAVCCGGAYMYVRVGEEYDDVEVCGDASAIEHAYLSDFLYVYTRIEVTGLMVLTPEELQQEAVAAFTQPVETKP